MLRTPTSAIPGVGAPLAAALLAALALAGCGNKGDLYLPEPELDATGANALERALDVEPSDDSPIDPAADERAGERADARADEERDAAGAARRGAAGADR